MVDKTNKWSGSYDVVVVGGGSAGIAAAIGAAQAGASVCLIEKYGFLGGAATVSSVLTHCGFFDQMKEQVVKGVGQQLLDELKRRGLYQTQTFEQSGNTVVLLDLETTKSVYDKLVTAAGITLLLHSYLVSATLHEGRLAEVQVAHRGGQLNIRGRAFVDCSGDGALIEAAGALELVSEVQERQASTLVMRVGGVQEGADLTTAAMATAILEHGRQTGELLFTNGLAVRMPVTREVMLLLADQHVDVLDVSELTRAEVTARELSWKYFHAFTRNLAGWESAYLSSTGPQIGIRESRRLKGQASVTADDVTAGRKRPGDVIGRCGWPMEDHVTPGATKYGRILHNGWYDIPYGAICSVSIDNLWAGGRLVSSDNQAYASLRVMGTSFATGHACGVAASIYADLGRHDYPLIRHELLQQGALL